jgi:hypothetical protein
VVDIMSRGDGDDALLPRSGSANVIARLLRTSTPRRATDMSSACERRRSERSGSMVAT